MHGVFFVSCCTAVLKKVSGSHIIRQVFKKVVSEYM